VAGSIELAIQKAFTARIFDISTGVLAELAQPGKPLYGIHVGNDGKMVIFGGELPIRRKGAVIGGIGASAGTVEQDISVAEAGVMALDPLLHQRPRKGLRSQRYLQIANLREPPEFTDGKPYFLF
jgi:uncharacterized protein GlcG (DUF336 family)